MKLVLFGSSREYVFDKWPCLCCSCAVLVHGGAHGDNADVKYEETHHMPVVCMIWVCSPKKVELGVVLLVCQDPALKLGACQQAAEVSIKVVLELLNLACMRLHTVFGNKLGCFVNYCSDVRWWLNQADGSGLSIDLDLREVWGRQTAFDRAHWNNSARAGYGLLITSCMAVLHGLHHAGLLQITTTTR